MNIWNLTKKDLQVFFRDRGALLYLFVLPLVFILIFAGLGGRSQSSSAASVEKDDRPELAVVNQDAGGGAAAQFLEVLDQVSGYRPVLFDAADAVARMNKMQLVRYLLIPAGFSAGLEQAHPVNLELVFHPSAGADGNQAMLEAVSGAANDMALELQLLDGLRQMSAMQAGNTAFEQAFAAERITTQAKTQFARARQQPLVNVALTAPTQEASASQAVDFNYSQILVPGFTVLFVFLSATAVARAVFTEKKAGCLRRLAAAPLSRSELLAGKMVPVVILTLIQIAFIFLAGALLFPLLGFGQVSIGANLLPWLIASLVIALCAASMGVLLVGLARTEGQITGLGNALLWIAGMLGGALLPTFMFPPFLQGVAHLVPHYWATEAYNDILVRGKGLGDILPGLGVLLLFTAVFFFIGQRRFRFE